MPDSGLRRAARHRAAALSWTFVVLVLCVLPGGALPSAPTVGLDKFVHATLFFVFAVLWVIRDSQPLTICIAVAGMLLAVSTEILQEVLPLSRSGDPFDALADAAGLFLGLLMGRAGALRRFFRPEQL